MPVEIGSFDSDTWYGFRLAKYHAVNYCKLTVRKRFVRTSFWSEDLNLFEVDKAAMNTGRLNIISCNKGSMENLNKGISVLFLAYITATKTKDKSKGNDLKDVLLFRIFLRLASTDTIRLATVSDMKELAEQLRNSTDKEVCMCTNPGPYLREVKISSLLLRCFKDGFGRCVDAKRRVAELITIAKFRYHLGNGEMVVADALRMEERDQTKTEARKLETSEGGCWRTVDQARVHKLKLYSSMVLKKMYQGYEEKLFLVAPIESQLRTMLPSVDCAQGQGRTSETIGFVSAAELPKWYWDKSRGLLSRSLTKSSQGFMTTIWVIIGRLTKSAIFVANEGNRSHG
ncbi:hypothetical protein Tco_1457343 [Tanacetum coccineum]